MRKLIGSGLLALGAAGFILTGSPGATGAMHYYDSPPGHVLALSVPQMHYYD